MVGNMYLFAICTLVIGIEAKTINIAPSYPYIFNLELKFNAEKINDYIIDSFFATNEDQTNKLLHCDITLSDILKAIPYKKLAASDFATAVNELNLALTDDDIGNLISNLDYSELSAMGFTMEKLYKSLSKTYFKTRPADLLECLNILGIAEDFSVAHTFGTDEDLFKAFQKANFSRDNLAQISNIINTPTTLKDILNILGVKKFNEIYLANFVNTRITPILFEKGLTEENFKRFLTSLNVSIGNYKNSKTFKNCYSTLTNGNSLAVATSNNEIITNDDSVVLKYLNLEKYSTLLAKNVQSEDISYTILADNIDGNRTDNIIRITIDAISTNFIEETSTYSDITDKFCHYVSIFDDELQDQNVAANVVNDQLVISKLYNTHFKKGSPLICGQKLYGLASIDKTSAIVFDTVEESFSEEMSSLPEHYKPEILNIIREFFEEVKINFDPCEYNLCNKGEEKEVTGNEGGSDDSAPTEENNGNIITEENNDADKDITVEDNVNENTDENNNLEQNGQEGDIVQGEEETHTDQSLVTDEEIDVDGGNDIPNNPHPDNDQPEENAENNDQVSGNNDNIYDPSQSSQEAGNQSNVNDSDQDVTEGNGNQENVDNSNQIPQEGDDSQTNVDETNQEAEVSDDNQANVDNSNQIPEEGDGSQSDVGETNQEPQESDDNQANGDNSDDTQVGETNEEAQVSDDNQANVDNSVQIPEEGDDSQANVGETNQESQDNANEINETPQDANDNEANVSDLNQEAQEENGDGELGQDETIQNGNEQEVGEDANIGESNQVVLEGRTA